ncbi:PREDICTED: UDP-glycosyltransferase 71C4-like [Tarenaya hassleriana]|uniref:UDP-glycosyltransferase 71C4-like n=1 Tax=Tarenaya hassleriana TaxID=28532 RepID=UPI00053C226D|nr:PREDICTED: UDP-glycosyltransferase 71C4-like [Tarenaya hassleriana]
MVKEAELIFVPVPSTGHLLVAIEFAKRLIDLDRRINTITALLWKTPSSPHADVFAHSLVASEPRIRLYALPDVPDPPPLELYARAPGAFNVQFVKKISPLVRDAVSSIVESRRGSDSVWVAGLVLDFFCNPLIDVGNELNLPSYIFMTCNARYLGMMKYLTERHRNIPSALDRSSGEEELPVPGFLKPVPTKVMPSGLFDRDAYEVYIELAERLANSRGILVNSFSELEPEAFDYFGRLESYPPVYPVGPILSLKDRPSPNLDPAERDRIMRWLDEQPDSSVVFFCFGSVGILGAPQLKEIAQALEFVGCRFVWSIRTKTSEKTNPYDLLPDGFDDRVKGQGVVCGWAPQVEVLAHKAIGGFVSHCGWNSTLESLWYGVPTATGPMYAEQQLNAFAMAKEVGLAVELRVDYVSAHGEIVTADEIARAVRSLMDGGEGRRERVKEMKEAARKAVMEGGSSFSSVTAFIEQVFVS